MVYYWAKGVARLRHLQFLAIDASQHHNHAFDTRYPAALAPGYAISGPKLPAHLPGPKLAHPRLASKPRQHGTWLILDAVAGAARRTPAISPARARALTEAGSIDRWPGIWN